MTTTTTLNPSTTILTLQYCKTHTPTIILRGVPKTKLECSSKWGLKTITPPRDKRKAEDLSRGQVRGTKTGRDHDDSNKRVTPASFVPLPARQQLDAEHIERGIINRNRARTSRRNFLLNIYRPSPNITHFNVVVTVVVYHLLSAASCQSTTTALQWDSQVTRDGINSAVLCRTTS